MRTSGLSTPVASFFLLVSTAPACGPKNGPDTMPPSAAMVATPNPAYSADPPEYTRPEAQVPSVNARPRSGEVDGTSDGTSGKGGVVNSQRGGVVKHGDVPSGPMATPASIALSCQSEAPCGLHHCNLQHGKCAYPCVSAGDCIAPNDCVAGICVPEPSAQH